MWHGSQLMLQPTALKHLHPTFKQARSFEVRRLVKKVKFLRLVNSYNSYDISLKCRTKPNSAEEVKDLEAQLALLTVSLTSVVDDMTDS